MALPCTLSSEGRQRRIRTIGTYVPPKAIKEKKTIKLLPTLLYNYCIREKRWLIRKQWWLIVATPDCETAVLGSHPAISPTYSGLPILRWVAILDGTSL
jgi:hypothetical protein